MAHRYRLRSFQDPDDPKAGGHVNQFKAFNMTTADELEALELAGMDLQDGGSKFEKGRIAVLQQERVYIQKKTFTKWCNSFLEKAHLQIGDLFVDLADGKLLMKLLEIISGENLGRPNKGVLRVQKIENVNKSIMFLRTKVRLESIGAEDIVDGNPRLILGLIWTVILRFQIQDIEIELDEENESGEKKSAKDALLLWCQRRTHGYPNVKIDNFSSSWRSGLGFNALIHAHRPDLINFHSLHPAEHIANLNNAFEVAEAKLGITKLLDAEDIDVAKPDEKSVITYVAAYYHYFAKMKTEMTGGKRIAKVVSKLLELDNLQNDYEALVTNLLEWIVTKIQQLRDRHFPNSLEGCQMEMINFKNYITTEKPPKYRERGNIEALFFNILTRLKSNGQHPYVPPDGLKLSDIERAWQILEKAEHDRELTLREEILRQERLEKLAERFERKAALRESWVNDMVMVVSDQNFGNNTLQVEAALKKHEAISSDVDARKDRFVALSNMAQELYHENYHGRDKIKHSEQQIMTKWEHLIELLNKKRRVLMGFAELLGMFREIESIQVEMKDMEPSLRSEDYGKHLLSVEDLLQKHHLIEAQINALGSRVRQLSRTAQPHMKSLHAESQLLQKRLEVLNKDFENINTLCKTRKAKLEESRKFYQFLQDSEEEESWLVEKVRVVKSTDTGKDLIAIISLLKKHEVLKQEMDAQFQRCQLVCKSGESLIENDHYAKRDIRLRIKNLLEKWQRLRELADQRQRTLDDAYESHQYYADAMEAESWMREKMPLVCSEDYGRDESSAQNLLQRHVRLEQEIRAYGGEIDRLDKNATLMTKAANVHKLQVSPEVATKQVEEESEEEEVEEWVDVPYEVEVEEIVERDVVREEPVERKLPQVKAMYPYKGQGMKVEKGEVMILLQKTNSDWWSVRQASGNEGYVPANYVKDVEPKIVRKMVKRQVRVPEKVKVKKTEYRKEKVMKKKNKKATKLRRTPSVRSQANLHFDKVNVEQRQQTINETYGKLCNLGELRHRNLEDAVKLFRFIRECDNFEAWMNDKEQLLQTQETLSENVEGVKRKFEALITDLAANAHTLDEINLLADDMIRNRHNETDFIRQRQKQMNDRWAEINRLKMNKEKTLQGASSIELFQNMCDELKDWIKEKNGVLSNNDLGKDMRSVRDLQRKHQNLEYELGPIQEKLDKMNPLATAVKQSYPDEAGYVNQRQSEIMDMWDTLKDKMDKRKKQLSDAEQKQKFKEEARDLEMWLNDIKGQLSHKDIPRDVTEAEEFIKKHKELLDDINTNKQRFDTLEQLGREILKKNPNVPEVRDKLSQLRDDQNNIFNMWDRKYADLKDGHELQVFLREADQIDSVTASHEAFLDFDDLGTTVDGVEALMKRHEVFENTLMAQEERIRALNEMADYLIDKAHPESSLIDERCNQVIARRDRVKGKCQERRKALLASQAFQEFKRDAEELSDWVKEKWQTATDESYRDLTNLLPKLQKHQAFEKELKANSDRLEVINQIGEAMIEDGHFASPEIAQIMDKLNREWRELYERSRDKGEKLRQAAQQELFNKALEDAEAKLDEMERLVSSDDLGRDLRGVKDLLKKHQLLEQEMAVNTDNLKTIVKQGKEMARAGHFDSASILRQVEDFDRRFNALKRPVAERRAKLEDSLKLHQYNFDVDNEQSWIREHMPGATSTNYGKNFIDAQNLHKSHQKFTMELANHNRMIEKVMANGEALIDAKHFASPQIEEKNEELQEAWDNLQQNSNERKRKLDINLQKQMYLSNAQDMESMIAEKMQLVSSQDYGRDENAADKLLTKHKALEADLKGYVGMVDKLGKEAEQISRLDPVIGNEVVTKQDDLRRQLRNLQNASADRRRHLEDSKRLHEYLRESGDFEEWIADQMVIAASEDYGQDYEHLQIIQNKFTEFQHTIDAGQERLNQCDELANLLIENKSPYAAEIGKRQQELKDSWNDLQEAIESRHMKLYGAGEIHRFNRDVEDALTRIQEKYASIPEDLGRDIKQVQSYIKKHEGFVNELVALEAQLQVLVDDSARLQEAYPGGNAEQIEQQKNVVIENWGILEERATQRRDDLQAALDYYRFLASSRDLEAWAQQKEREMMTEEPVRDVASVEFLRDRHREIKAEIDAREDVFADVIQEGRDMIDEKHFQSKEIDDKVTELLALRERLYGTWQERLEYLNQLYAQQAFYRDANQLDTLSLSQEAYLSSTDLGHSPDQVEALVKKHEAFENVLTAQDQKLEALKDNGLVIVQEDHFDAPSVQNRLEAVVKRRESIKRLSDVKNQQLNDNMLYTQFNRDAAEADSWIQEKLVSVSDEPKLTAVTDLQDKMKKLKKHQAFEAEIVANTDRIRDVQEKGQVLLSKQHVASAQIDKQLKMILGNWQDLLGAAENRGKGLEEAKDLLQFNEEVNKVLDWVREKETLVAAGDMGRDYEHCLELQKRIDGVEGVTVDAERVRAINQLADRLIAQGRTDVNYVTEKKATMNEKWMSIQGSLKLHKQKLAAALEIHAFNRDVDDIDDRINEKCNYFQARPRLMQQESITVHDLERAASVTSIELSPTTLEALAMSVDDFGRDLAGVTALQRKQEEVERDMTALQAQLEKIERRCDSLCRKYPENGVQIQEKQKQALDDWEQLEDLANARKLKLEDSYQLHKFLTDAKEHITWCQNMMTAMTTGDLAKDVLEAEEQLEMHNEKKAEIDGRHQLCNSLKGHGDQLIEKGHYASEDVRRMQELLDQAWYELNITWEDRKQLLTQCYDLQVYEEYAEKADSWLANKEAFLANEDLGNSIGSVDELLKKHSGFEKTLEAQEEKIDTLEQLAQALLAQDHYASNDIEARCQGVLERRENIKRQSHARKQKLVDSRNFQLFKRNVSEVTVWISGKVKIATDESYRDPTNLKGKIQKHQAFEAELAANKRRLDAVAAEGDELIEAKHYLSSDIEQRIDELTESWKLLEKESGIKRERLLQAYQVMLFNRQCDDFESWMDDVETQLISEDHGKDVTSATILLKKHQLLEQDITIHQEKVNELMDGSRAFINNGNFLGEETQDRVKNIRNRYNGLPESCQIRRDNLEDALLLYQFQRDVEDELSWIKEKLPLAGSRDLGNSLTAVQNLQKKHMALEAEIVAHEPLIEAVANTAHHMVEKEHYAASQITEQLDDLHIQLQQLKDMVAERRLKLLDAVESQMFYSEIAEAESWMNERKPLLTNPDLGKDEDTVQALIKKLDALDLDIDNFNNNVGELAALCQGLVERGHFDSKNISQQQTVIETQYRELQDLSAARRAKLVDNRKLYEFHREADEVVSWIKDKVIIAESEDYGTDLEHVEVLQQKFDNFLHDLHANEDRINTIQVMCETLVAGQHSQSQEIQRRYEEISQMWMDVKDISYARQQALAGARQVHTFVRDTDDTIDWIQEKERVLEAADYGQDIETLQALIVKHEGFQQDLAAISEQVNSITKEAETLLVQFPDAQEHIHGKHEEMVQIWNVLLEKATQRKDKLHQAEDLQMYFGDYYELVAWCNEMMALITSEELAKDVAGAEAVITRHKEHKSEIDLRLKDVARFAQRGQTLISQGHFMSDNIQEKITHLDHLVDTLRQTWDQRNTIYAQNLDLLQLKRDMDALDTWMNCRDNVLQNPNLGDSIESTEELLRKHFDFEKTVFAQEDKFTAIKRSTLLELAFDDQKRIEEHNRIEEEKKQQKLIQEEMKRKEQERILDGRRTEDDALARGLSERRHEEEKRKAQEILLKRRREIEEAEEQERAGRANAARTPDVQRLKAEEVTDIMTRTPSFRAKKTPETQLSPIEVSHPPETQRSPELSPKEKQQLSPSAKSDEGAPTSRLDDLKKESTKPKRTLSLRTKRPQSFKDKYRLPSELPPSEMEGMLERKQELQSGGKKATMRSWKFHYTVLCGKLLCFFKDRHAFLSNQAASPPLILHNAICEIATDYTKKKNVLRLKLHDGSEYLFNANSQNEMVEWLGKIQFYAVLPPSEQLQHYDPEKAPQIIHSSPTSSRNSDYRPASPNSSHLSHQGAGSPASSRSSQSGDVTRPHSVSPRSGSMKGDVSHTEIVSSPLRHTMPPGTMYTVSAHTPASPTSPPPQNQPPPHPHHPNYPHHETMLPDEHGVQRRIRNESYEHSRMSAGSSLDDRMSVGSVPSEASAQHYDLNDSRRSSSDTPYIPSFTPSTLHPSDDTDPSMSPSEGHYPQSTTSPAHGYSDLGYAHLDENRAMEARTDSRHPERDLHLPGFADDLEDATSLTAQRGALPPTYNNNNMGDAKVIEHPEPRGQPPHPHPMHPGGPQNGDDSGIYNGNGSPPSAKIRYSMPSLESEAARDAREYSQSVSQTLPPGTSPPSSGDVQMRRHASLDRGKGKPPLVQKADKKDKHRSMLGSIFKRKKDKE